MNTVTMGKTTLKLRIKQWLIMYHYFAKLKEGLVTELEERASKLLEASLNSLERF